MINSAGDRSKSPKLKMDDRASVGVTCTNYLVKRHI